MSEPTNTPIAGAQTPQDARAVPAAPVVSLPSLPWQIPPGMTPEQAGQRVRELERDPNFAAGYCKGGMDSREFKEHAALLHHSLGEAQPETQATKPQDPVEQPPTTPEGYQLHDPYLQLTDDGKAQLGELQQLAHAAALPASWFSMISKQASVDAARYSGLDAGDISDRVDEQLRSIFPGDAYDKAAAGATAIIAEMEAKTPGLRDKLTQMGLNRNIALLTHLLNRGLARAPK